MSKRVQEFTFGVLIATNGTEDEPGDILVDTKVRATSREEALTLASALVPKEYAPTVTDGKVKRNPKAGSLDVGVRLESF